MATKLNQTVAVEKSVKAKAHGALTDAYQTLQKPALLAGLSRTYQPLDDEGEQLPAESTRVQVKVGDLSQAVTKALVDLFDVTATKEWGNTEAKADVVVDGRTIVEGAPVTYLLFLEKQLVDLRTYVAKLPTLDPAQSWSFDAAADSFASEPVETTRSKKVPRNHVKAEATKEHPAQVEVYYEDVIVGRWRKIEFSGAIPAEQANEMLARVEALQRAVKEAREEANGLEVEKREVGAAVLDYLFAG